MKARFFVLLFCAALALPLFTGCVATTSGEVYATIPPPAAVVEVQGVAPGPDYVWIDGYHRWDGRAYYWSRGRWERRPYAGATWESGRWDRRDRGWIWIDGRWR